MNNTTLIMYSHDSYSDSWPLFFGQCEKYLEEMKKVLFTSKPNDSVPDDWEVILYDDDALYTEKMLMCLDKIDTDLCFIHQEDMPLYDEPNLDKINELASILRKGKLDFIKLIRGVDGLHFPLKYDNLYRIPSQSPYLFALQPSLWKTDRLKMVYKETKSSKNTAVGFEEYVQETCRQNKILGSFYYDNEPKRGEYHYDCSIYPYVATAITHGKWNITEYPEVVELLKEYDIDSADRGIM